MLDLAVGSIKALELKPGELRVIVNATTTSTVKSETEVTLSAQRTGRVVKLPVQVGDLVKAGALIAQLDLAEESVQTANALLQIVAVGMPCCSSFTPSATLMEVEVPQSP